MKRRKSRRNKPQLFGWRALVAGLGIGLATLILTSIITAIICYTSSDPMAIADIAAFISLLSAGALSGFIVPRITEGYAVLPAVISALMLPLFLLAIGIAISGGVASPKIPLGYLCYFGVSALVSLLSKKTARG